MAFNDFVERSDKLTTEDDSSIGWRWSKILKTVLKLSIVSLLVIVVIKLVTTPRHDSTDENWATAWSVELSNEKKTDDETDGDDRGDANSNEERETILDAPLYTVASVVDGDTIKIYYDGVLTSVRLIGVNTPETVDPRKPIECFGMEASNFLKQLLTGKEIIIEADATQTDRDKYNRLLRYVYLDGKDVGLKIIENGYGMEYTYNVPYTKQTQYRDAQDKARREGLGLWAETACEK